MADVENRRKKSRTFNILKADPDFENCNGWSLTGDQERLPCIEGFQHRCFHGELDQGLNDGATLESNGY
ncbi:hypothetical protein L1049_025309 [Liquidambar formosana]|uniref:Uncharacterized protein n=1 Tax=Liquidambar formosana TaxID=63359 RepID=A0AAP0N5W7_LIQFO